MTRPDIPAIRERCEKATLGPWYVPNAPYDKAVAVSIGNKAKIVAMAVLEDGADAQFIAHAREDVPTLLAEFERLRLRVLTAAGDDLCRLTQDEIKELSSGAVKIPPKEEFIASCERLHAQIASTSGVQSDCLTLAQMIAENESLLANIANLEAALAAERERAACIVEGAWTNAPIEPRSCWRLAALIRRGT